MAESTAPNGFDVEVLVATGDSVTSQIAQLVANDLKAINVNLKVTELEPGAKRDRRTAFDFEINTGYYTTDIIDPDELTNFAVESDGGAFSVWTQYKNPDVDKLIEDARIEQDAEKRLTMYSQIQQMTTTDAPFLYLFYPTGNTATNTAVQDFKILPTGNYRLWETWRNDQ